MQHVGTREARIGFTVDGTTGRPPLLLLMGLGGSASEWGDQFLDALRPHLTVIRPDNRGVGHSDNHAETFSMEDMADDAARVLDALSLPRAHVAGMSMGGMIAQQLALSHPSRVTSLMLIGTHFGGPEVVPLQPRAEVLFKPQPPGTTRHDYYRLLFTQLAAEGFGERMAALGDDFIEARVSAPVPLTVYRNQLHALLASDRSQAVASLRHACLVIHGQDDPLIPIDNGRNLAARIPGAQLLELPRCGHLPTWEQPEVVAQAMLDFIAGLPSPMA